MFLNLNCFQLLYKWSNHMRICHWAMITLCIFILSHLTLCKTSARVSSRWTSHTNINIKTYDPTQSSHSVIVCVCVSRCVQIFIPTLHEWKLSLIWWHVWHVLPDEGSTAWLKGRESTTRFFMWFGFLCSVRFIFSHSNIRKKYFPCCIVSSLPPYSAATYH